jgi:uncharacterized protein (TIGR03435 family)
MQAMDDMALLREYATGNSETAFETLVSRHVSFVYSAALRQTRDPHLAEEVTQAVFIILAQKAGKISNKTILTGWLFKATRFTALAQTRAAVKHRRREQEVQMQSEFQSPAADEIWNQMSPLLDEALAALGEKDRQAVLLRFFENKSLAEVGNMLGMGEDTARKRVSRALGKLHRYFNRRGISSTTAIIAGQISANSIQPVVPAALAKSVTAAALAKGTAASTSTLTLIKGALKIMAWTKAKIAIVTGAGLLVAAGTTTVVVEKAISPAMDGSLWEAKVENLDKAPPVLIIRPTRFSDIVMVVGGPGGQVISSQNRPVMNRTIAHNLDVGGLIQFAYACYSRPKLVLPAGVPTNHFDLMLTLRTNQLETLQKAIQRQFGLAAHREIRETEALQLQVKDPGLLAMHASKPGSKMDLKTGTNFWSYSNSPFDRPAEILSEFFSQPVVLEPGLSGNYDFTYRWENPDDRKPAVSKELAQAGLELVPTNMPIEMLVVEKVK